MDNELTSAFGLLQVLGMVFIFFLVWDNAPAWWRRFKRSVVFAALRIAAEKANHDKRDY